MNPAILALLLSLPQAAPDTAVVCPEEFRPAIAPWLQYRAHEGHTLVVLSNLPSAQEIRDQIRQVAKEGALKFVLLVGDADPEMLRDPAVRRRCLPTHYVPARVNVAWGSEPYIATDNPYADLDDDQLPELAVGRLTADTPAELATMVQKIISYERSTDFGSWRRQLNLVAGVGRFGMLADMLLESATRYFVTQAIPESYRFSLTYASCHSPYCPDPRQFRHAALEGLNEGAWLWIYVGHGNHLELDSIHLPGGDYPILTADDAPQIQCRHGAPVALFLSCYAGAFDATEDCLAEQLLRAPGGPVAVLAGSRVTMPYGMAVMSNELINQCFHDHCATLGEAVQRAKRRMVEETSSDDPRRKMLDDLASAVSPAPGQLAAERAEHALLFNLLGDPLLRLRYPRPIQLAVGSATPGAPLSVTGTSPVDGHCLVELAVPPGTVTFPRPVRPDFPRDDASLAQFQRVYQRANDCRLTMTETVVAGGRFQATLQVPHAARGRCLVRVFVAGPADCAAGSSAVQVRD
jgi:hypothetical protein